MNIISNIYKEEGYCSPLFLPYLSKSMKDSPGLIFAHDGGNLLQPS